MLGRPVKPLQKSVRSLFESEVKINDFAVQSYPAHSLGIGIHKDGLRYRNLVFILPSMGSLSYLSVQIVKAQIARLYLMSQAVL